MKAGELAWILSRVDPDLEVITEGCDCEGEANSVEVVPQWDGLDVVMVNRGLSGWWPGRAPELVRKSIDAVKRDTDEHEETMARLQRQAKERMELWEERIQDWEHDEGGEAY